ncbi:MULTISPECIES: (2Fe-2S)-binding protein [unclassified Streptomyces]|uniref:(2Fe-2S)-binding protein n=1 Tax=unclassified Streptomyces TaxID=2593676 RepID=UPI0022B6AD33|nr:MULTISPECIES: (2Fe-2S)-binding protein [unclassified Streptomyces]MCZ7413695.1 (2Fe-2S)-binding protein [Streptomyces sp. WMMC897]MCZ7430691.1 (2Fe-2S)-binding protein [Streptomyces sp. WMMC1477]
MPTTTAPPDFFDVADLAAETYRRFAAAFPILRVTTEPPEGEGWLTGRRLVEDEGLRALVLARQAQAMEATQNAAPRPDVVAMEMLHQYAFVACLAMSAPWYLERRVPWLELDGVGYDETRGALALVPSRITVLPDDPAAALPGARTVPDEAALRAELRAAVAAHLAPLLTAFTPLLRRGPRGMWGVATDELADGLGYLGDLLGDRPAAAAAANALLPGGTPPFSGAARYRDDGSRVRHNCCLYYTFPAARLCASCPRLR